MALDIGDKRIGIALSDPMKILASPFDTVIRENDDKDMEKIARLARENNVELIVSGLPKRLDNQSTLQTEKVQAFCDGLKNFTEIKIVYWDERFSTVSANRALLEGNVSRDKRKGVVDKVAASIILQAYLESGQVK